MHIAPHRPGYSNLDAAAIHSISPHWSQTRLSATDNIHTTDTLTPLDATDDEVLSASLDPINAPDLLPPVVTSPEHEAIIAQFGALFPFPLDEFQRRAIQVLLNDESVMVAAPTPRINPIECTIIQRLW